MTREWKVGDLAETTHQGRKSVALVVAGASCSNTHPSTPHWHGATGGWNPLSDTNCTYRPLVVIDPERGNLGQAIAEALDFPEGSLLGDAVIAATKDVLDSLVAPPKPDEPQGLGAVVEDEGGRRWVRVEPEGIAVAWTSHVRGEIPKEYSWPNIAAVHVLSEGVA